MKFSPQKTCHWTRKTLPPPPLWTSSACWGLRAKVSMLSGSTGTWGPSTFQRVGAVTDVPSFSHVPDTTQKKHGKKNICNICILFQSWQSLKNGTIGKLSQVQMVSRDKVKQQKLATWPTNSDRISPKNNCTADIFERIHHFELNTPRWSYQSPILELLTCKPRCQQRGMKESGNKMKQIFQFLASFFHRTFLGGGFNPIEKYESKWESSPIFGVKIKNIQNDHLDPSIDTNVITFSSHDWSCFFILEIQVFETFSRFPLWLTSGPLSLVLWLSLGNILPVRNSQYPEISLQMLPSFTRIRKEDFAPSWRSKLWKSETNPTRKHVGWRSRNKTWLQNSSYGCIVGIWTFQEDNEKQKESSIPSCPFYCLDICKCLIHPK